MSIAVGARANSPVPAVPLLVEQLARSAARAGKGVSIIQIDGRIDVDLPEQFFTSKAGNPNKYDKDLDKWIRGLHDWIGNMRADEPEADVLKALDVAGAHAKAGGTVVLMDSGLQTRPPLDFSEDGLLEADPATVVDYLRKIDSLPDLHERNVLMVGLGDTAPPQAELDIASRRNLIAIWTEIAKAAGASCIELREMSPGVATPGEMPPVRLVPVPVATFPSKALCTEWVLRDRGALGFHRDSAGFRDPAAARNALASLADELKSAPGARVELIGTTSSAGTERGRQLLSEDRAAAVARILVELGVPAGRITSRGVGANWPNRVPDRGPNNELLPGPAARNRSVVVRVTCP